jgi:DNA polymerase (family 10)
MNNQKIAAALEQFADLLEFTGANPFRLKAYRNGARVIRELPESVTALLQSNADLTAIDGIGKSVAEKCQELAETGRLGQLDEILETVPKTVLDLLNVPKLGPKKAATLFHELGITNLDQLRQACETGKVRALTGFGEKTESAILAGIEIAASANRRVLWAKANQWVDNLREYLSYCPSVQQLEFAGSYRRGKDTVGDLDILVTSDEPPSVMDYFAAFEDVVEVIARGETKMSVRNQEGFQIDLRVVPAESFGAALQYFTGSKEHNVTLRGRAKALGLKVNEWGVFKADSDERIGGRTEQEVYVAIGLPWIEPELREGRREFDWAVAGQLPRLIEVSDILGDLHMHTVASDGKATIEEMAAAAKQRGLKYIAITDHSKRVSVANGLNAERLLAQWREIDTINARAEDGFQILKGIECDILENGEMDLPDDVLAQADWVIASLHFGQSQPRQQITERILNAIENPHVDLIAHPTGRLLNQREPYDVDIEAVFQAARTHRKKLELNASPKRLDLNDVHLAAAKSLGIPIVINTDAHRIVGLDDLRYGIKQARRAGLTADDVANTKDWKTLLGLQ